MAKGKFKTALGQRTVIVNCKVLETVHVGDLVMFTDVSSGDGLSTFKELRLADSLEHATHIVALSDMTSSGMVNYIGDGYSNDVFSRDDMTDMGMDDTFKNVGLYPILDVNDIIVSGTFPSIPT
jgi:hypothetical protein